MILSTRQAQQLGRLGGIESSRPRKGDSTWGRRAQRQRAAKAQKRHYPELSKAWARNANRARRRKSLESVLLVMTPAAIAGREARHLRKRREEYERNRAHGVPLSAPSRSKSLLRARAGVERAGITA